MARCIANIGPHQRSRRILIGVAMTVVTALIAIAFVILPVARPWRMLIVAPAWLAALGFIQVRYQTCVRLAASGLRNLDSGDEPIVDGFELAAVKAQARRVHVLAALIAAALTATVLALP